ncbi:ABC transporter ATP-binding protein [Candidatus Bathyarchaeota archaeon]|nr:ABC transporter ATP-binding protein [Candidatus Bathyarchaeota archaeon]
MVILEVENLTKIYVVGLLRKKEILAVNNISFRVSEKEFISLVGESGSGKTTTARMILRLLKPTSGSIRFQGRDVWSLKKMEDLKWYWRQVHGIFQDPFASYNPLYRIDRVLNQVFNLIGDIGADRESLIREALKEVGLRPDEVLGRYPHELSGGQRQRIMVARCYLLKPRLILADEPVSMIDASTRAGVLNLFSRLRDEYGTSVIFITHDLGLAYYVSDRIMIMYRGEIVEEGSPEEVMENPQHPYTRKLREDVPLLYRKWSGF